MSQHTHATHLTLSEGMTCTIRAGGDSGPENVITIDEFGIITIECDDRKLVIVSIDPGPGGIQFFVEGEHNDGQA